MAWSVPSEYLGNYSTGTAGVALWVVTEFPTKYLVPLFTIISQKEVVIRDKEFILKIMKIDEKNRPTAKELLEESGGKN